MGGVPISVNIPPSKAAIEIGIKSCDGAMSAFAARLSTIGIKIATAPVELIKADNPATTNISITVSFSSFVPATPISQSPTAKAIPVLNNPSPTIKSPAIKSKTGSPKPDSASVGVSRPLNKRAKIAPTATTSRRTLSLTKRDTTTSSKIKTNNISKFIINLLFF